MRTIFNRLKLRLILILITSLALISCEKDKLEIQSDFPFEVEVMPVPKEVPNGGTVEIRIDIKKTGNYRSTQYYIRYFQFDGRGVLQYYNDIPYNPNDLYLLPKEQFRLYYTSISDVSQAFEVWISDSFGNEKQLSFKFNSTNSDE